MATRPRSVGRSVRRLDGDSKVTGAARYVDDLTFPGMLHGTTVRSTVPHGRIRSIDLRFDTSGFVVAGAPDIPGRNVVALIADDQPALADAVVRHVAEPILLVAHEHRERLLDAHVEIQYERQPPVLDPLGSPTTFKAITLEKGAAADALASADIVIEGEYRTGHQEQLYIETNGVIAVPEDGGITVHGSMQCPYYVHKALKILLGLPAGSIRVVQSETGGGFGGKEEYPSILAGHAAILALKAHRPVKMIYDRVEDMAATTKRHPSVIRHRTGVTREGRLVAMDIEVVMDGGAYVTLSPVVLSRGIIHACGAYRCDHVRIHGRVVMTNTPPNGAFRGFGAPQTQFAMEAHMDVIAERLGLDPVTIRERNALRPGDTTATGQEMGEDCSALPVLREAARRTDFRRKHRRFLAARARPRRGIGLSLFLHGAGFTGAGEVLLASRASLELTPRGARILVANTEIGQGTRTMLAQIVADALRLPYDAIEVGAADTAHVPDSGPTVASRTCMVVGGLLARCAEEMRGRLGRLSPAAYLRRHGPLVVTKEYEKPPGVAWDDEAYRGQAYATYSWGCDVVEIEVDEATGQVRPLGVTAVQEIGRAVHPKLAAGQIEGGTVQGLGYALLEDVVMRDGAMANAQLTNYIIPTTLDTPSIDVVIIENAYQHGPFGAKGVGELPMDGPAPAVVNALRNAGVAIASIPATPERVLEQASGVAGPSTRPSDR